MAEGAENVADGAEAVAGGAEGPAPAPPWVDLRPPAVWRLLEARVAAFAERGYHATTTRDIAARAGMSPAALYVHYPSKEALLFEISRVGHERARDALRTAGTGDAEPTERLRAMVHAFAAWHARHHTLGRVVQYEFGALAPEHARVVARVRREIEDSVREVLRDGAARGALDVADVAGTALALLSLCIDVARWYRPGGRWTPEDVGALRAGLALRMCAA